MLRRLIALFLALMLATAVAAAIVVAAVPDGPRLAVLKLTHGPARPEIATLGPLGEEPRRVLASAAGSALRLGPLSAPVWSPDGDQIAFSHRDGHGRSVISLVPASGGRPQAVPGTKDGFLPVFSPDGRSLAFARTLRRGLHRYQWGSRWDFESTAVWIVDLETGVRRQLTQWRHDLEHYPSSFSPDGATLLVMRMDYRERSGDLEAVALRFDGRTSSLFIGEGWFPVYSPDGSRIALSRQTGRREDPPTDLFVIDADGSYLRQLSRTPGKFELAASWDPSGERIAYSQFRGYPFDQGSRGSIMQINADGTCEREILSAPHASFYGPVWQPGPGREAGRIDC